MDHEPIPLVRRTKRVQFSLWNNEQLASYAACTVTSLDMFDNNEPQFSGLFDLRMGTCDSNFLCYTCQEPVTKCVGHFGRLPLVRPVYWWHFMAIVIKLMQLLCHSCSKPLVALTPRFAAKLRTMSPMARFGRMLRLCATKRFCGHCGLEHMRFVRDNFQIYAKTGKKKDEKELYPIEHVYRTLDRIPSDMVELIGFDPLVSHPRNLICYAIPVAPPAIRPSMLHDASLRSEGDLTFGLLEIVKSNRNLMARMNDPALDPAVKDAHYKLLQYHVTTMIDNRISGIPPAQQRSGRMLKGIRQKIKGKDGRIRGNLMGKRVDFSARTVIGPDPSLDLDELGVPEYVAIRQTVPERVQVSNMERIRAAIRKGPGEWPGANVVEYGDVTCPKMKHLQYLTTQQRDELALALVPGDLVHRHLVHGDIVAFNRQPSLHKMSMMGHRVRVLPGQTFRINSSVCTPYNADFDGDEMNLFNPQSLSSALETQVLMGVPYLIVSPQNNKPVIGCIMDTLLGSRKFTLTTTVLSRQRTMTIVHALHAPDATLNLDRVIADTMAGRDVFSWFLPPYTLSKPPSAITEPALRIERGTIVEGHAGKGLLGAVSNSLIHWVWRDRGPIATRVFLKNTQNVLRAFLAGHGHSVGLGDCHMAQPDIIEYIRTQIADARTDVLQIVAEPHRVHGNSIAPPSLFWPVQRQKRHIVQQASVIRVGEQETLINNLLNKCRDQSGSRACDELDESNNIKSMVAAQSKGSFINISQIAAVVGQQNVQGGDDKVSRIPFGLKDRTLVHFPKFDHSPLARGFVHNSYFTGLSPDEFFFHAMSGREGLIDTAVKTSETGYIQRRLMKLMEDIIVHHDGTVRTPADSVIQFFYGGDGWDGSQVERVHMSMDKLPVSGPARDWIDVQLRTPFQLPMPTSIELFTPVPWPRLVKTSSANPLAALAWDDAWDRHVKQFLLAHTVIPMAAVPDAHPDVVLINSVALRNFRLYSIACLCHVTYDDNEWRTLLVEAQRYLRQGAIQAGEMVGPVAAQSIGEPSTQLTLNTFHYSGVASKTNVTRGVPRLKELITVSKTLKTPSLTIPLLGQPTATDLTRICHELTALPLGDLFIECSVHYDPTHAVDAAAFTSISCWDESATASPWLLRIVLDSATMCHQRVQVVHIINTIEWGSQLHPMIVRVSPEDPERMLLHVRYKQTPKYPVDASTMRKTERYLSQLHMHGLERVTRTFVRKSESAGASLTIDTNGTNLREILGLFHLPHLDLKRVISNDVTEVFQVLGIEAARTVLLNELRFVMDSNGNYVNPRHLKILVDVMTSNGSLLAIDRHGIKKSDQSPFARASFEESGDQLARAAVFAETDDLSGVSSNIIMGQTAPFGTHFQHEFFLDTVKLTQWASA